MCSGTGCCIPDRFAEFFAASVRRMIVGPGHDGDKASQHMLSTVPWASGQHDDAGDQSSRSLGRVGRAVACCPGDSRARGLQPAPDARQPCDRSPTAQMLRNLHVLVVFELQSDGVVSRRRVCSKELLVAVGLHWPGNPARFRGPAASGARWAGYPRGVASRPSRPASSLNSSRS